MVSLSLRSDVTSFGFCFYKVIDLFSLKVHGVRMVSLNFKKVYHEQALPLCPAGIQYGFPCILKHFSEAWVNVFPLFV